MKYKPTLLPITKVVAEMGGSTGWTLLSGLTESVISTKLAQRGIPPAYSCGKPACRGSFNLMSEDERPQVCPVCGSEIDWAGIITKKVKRCPQCKKIGSDFDKYCKFHIPAVPLEEAEVPI